MNKIKAIIIGALVTLFALSYYKDAKIANPAQAPFNAPNLTGDTSGCWGFVNIDANFLALYGSYDVKGIHFTLGANQISTSPGVYDFSQLDLRLTQAADAGYFIGIQPQFGPDASPYMLDKSQGVDTFYTIRNGSPDGPYPDYFNATYKAWYFATQRAIIHHIKTLPQYIQDKIVYYQNSEGSTGDGEPYKGIPWNIADTIGEARWAFTWKYVAWDSLMKNLQDSLPTIKGMFNTNNDGLHLSYVVNRFGINNILIKEGTLSHDIGFDGEYTYYVRQTPKSRGEAQGYMILGGGSQHKNKEGFALICSALTGGLAILNLPQAWINNVHEAGQSGADARIIDFFNRYTNDANKYAFVVPSDRPNFADTIRFPTGTYGTLAKAGDSTALLNQRLFNLSDSGYALEFRNWRQIQVTAKMLSGQRVQVIRALFPWLGWNQREGEDPGGDHANSFDDDFTVGGVSYYHKNVTLVDPFINLVGGARIGPDSSMLGRWAAKGVIKMDIGNNMRSALATDNLKVTIHYFDDGTGTIYSTIPGRCTDKIVNTITLTNTDQWKSATFTINNFVMRQNGWDITTFAGPNYVGLITIENTSK